ncbi:hypothetical protein [Bermanella sp. R86510]|uniref:hypothetical protein n=1 Tax=unclassified Bermanella TaxID=2627862 RepID=UPI0037C5C917
MIILKEPMDLTYYDLHYIEVPMKAIRTIQALNDAVRPKDKLRNAHLVNLPPQRRRPYDAYKRIRFELEQGKFFLINTDTITPALRDISINDDDTIDFKYKAILTDVFKKRLNWGLTWVRIPRNTQVYRQAPAPQPEQPKPETKQKERHRIIIDAQGKDGRPLPEQHRILLYVENSSKGTQAIKQYQEVISDPFSRIIQIDAGDQLKVYAAPQSNKTIADDLKQNRNLKQSESNGLITALTETAQETRSDGVILHTFKYDVPNNMVEIELLDKDDNPEAGAKYHILDPNGKVLVKGTLDDNGYAMVDGLETEDVDVMFWAYEEGAISGKDVEK